MYFMFKSESTWILPEADLSKLHPLYDLLAALIVEESDPDQAVSKIEAKGFPVDTLAKGLRILCNCGSCPERWSSLRFSTGCSIADLLVDAGLYLCTESREGYEAVMVLNADGTETMYYYPD